MKKLTNIGRIGRETKGPFLSTANAQDAGSPAYNCTYTDDQGTHNVIAFEGLVPDSRLVNATCTQI